MVVEGRLEFRFENLRTGGQRSGSRDKYVVLTGLRADFAVVVDAPSSGSIPDFAVAELLDALIWWCGEAEPNRPDLEFESIAQPDREAFWVRRLETSWWLGFGKTTFGSHGFTSDELCAAVREFGDRLTKAGADLGIDLNRWLSLPGPAAPKAPETPLVLGGHPVMRVVAQVVLGYSGLSLGLALLSAGVIEVIGFFGEPTDLGRLEPLPVVVGLVLMVWTILGITKPTRWRFLPPALVSIPVVAAGWAWWLWSLLN